MNKKLQMGQLIKKLSEDQSIKSIVVKRKSGMVDVGLVNHFELHAQIPNKWFDWENRVDADFMIIGQDWGPYQVLKTYIDEYSTGLDYNQYLLQRFSSRTEKFIVRTIEKTYHEKYGDFNSNILHQIFFTMAVLFTRQGKHFRGNQNFDEKKSAELSFPYVSMQIDIVRPKVIMTLGGLAFGVVNKKFQLGYDKQNLTQIIASLDKSGGVIRKNNVIIIPNFHPAAHISPSIQEKIWKKVWEYL